MEIRLIGASAFRCIKTWRRHEYSPKYLSQLGDRLCQLRRRNRFLNKRLKNRVVVGLFKKVTLQDIANGNIPKKYRSIKGIAKLRQKVAKVINRL